LTFGSVVRPSCGVPKKKPIKRRKQPRSAATTPPKRSKRKEHPATRPLTGPQCRFCAAYAVDQNATEAYLRAYPKSSKAAARRSASDLLTKADIQTEIARIRTKAEALAGSAVLTLVEKRTFLARVVRTPIGEVNESSDLCQEKSETHSDSSSTTKLKMCDKLAAIKLDNDLAAEGAEAGMQKALEIIIRKL
jgi:type IV secretory pathway VirJ component